MASTSSEPHSLERGIFSCIFKEVAWSFLIGVKDLPGTSDNSSHCEMGTLTGFSSGAMVPMAERCSSDPCDAVKVMQLHGIWGAL